MIRIGNMSYITKVSFEPEKRNGGRWGIIDFNQWRDLTCHCNFLWSINDMYNIFCSFIRAAASTTRIELEFYDSN